ncbi:DUF547 domain-containing protein [Olleya sp. R77988]|uniref:DUF547 domain-containing protein n=1 Tax=Olleya sp. R77988 TaxID=3093875 RepID=UPI0037CC17E7
MKYISILLLSLCVCSCSSSKKTVTTPSKEIAKTEPVEQVVETVIENKKVEKIVTETEIKKDTIIDTGDFHQELTKSFRNITTHQLWDELLTENVSENGTVNYPSLMKNYGKLNAYINLLDKIKQKDLTVTKEQKLAFWINAYNAFTVDLILRNYPVKSIKDIKDPWKQRLWKLGDKWYNLDEIEHQILRKMDEPRIHFAIVCASYSCPKLQNTAFTAENLEAQLTNATKAFLNDPKHNQIEEAHLKLSKIFKWFAKDFKQNGSIVSFISKYNTSKISEDAKISYKDYNWDLND